MSPLYINNMFKDTTKKIYFQTKQKDSNQIMYAIPLRHVSVLVLKSQLRNHLYEETYISNT